MSIFPETLLPPTGETKGTWRRVKTAYGQLPIGTKIEVVGLKPQRVGLNIIVYRCLDNPQTDHE